jgi:hypothetical protein
MNKTLRYSLIGASVAAVALVGYRFFTRRKLMNLGQKLWLLGYWNNNPSARLSKAILRQLRDR